MSTITRLSIRVPRHPEVCLVLTRHKTSTLLSLRTSLAPIWRMHVISTIPVRLSEPLHLLEGAHAVMLRQSLNIKRRDKLLESCDAFLVQLTGKSLVNVHDKSHVLTCLCLRPTSANVSAPRLTFRPTYRLIRLGGQ